MVKEIKLFDVQIRNWAKPLLIRAYNSEDARELTQVLFKVPSDISIKATPIAKVKGE